MENIEKGKSCRSCVHFLPCGKRDSAEGFLTPCVSGGYSPNTDFEVIRREMLEITAKFCGDYLSEECVPNWDHKIKKVVKGE